jgi:thiol-disulfide isomerase/thioredoxin
LHAGDGIALRGLFIIDPKGILQHVTINNFPVGRSVDEAIRLINAFQYVEKHGEVCPANWHKGERAMKGGPEESQEYFNATWGSENTNGASSSKLTRVSNATEFKNVIESKKKVAVFYSAPWCGKCGMIAPHVEDLATQYPDITFVKLDTSEPALQELAANQGASVIPHFTFYHNKAKLSETVTGYKKKEVSRIIEDLHKK